MCKMSGRAVAACGALLAINLAISLAQDAVIHIKVPNGYPNEQVDVEKRMTSDLIRELNTAMSDVLLLYTEYTAKAGSDMKIFLNNIPVYADEALREVDKWRAYEDYNNCWDGLQTKKKKIEVDAYKAASYSSENHHKFLLGHMVVFRMHLNKTEEYIRKCEKALYQCGGRCENQPKVRRWKSLALQEIYRVKDDMQHTRRSYKDLVAHAKRRLTHLRKQINIRTTDAIEDYRKCILSTPIHN